MASGFKQRLNHVVEYFIPSEYKEDRTLYRESRIRVSIFLITALLYLIFIPNAYSLGEFEVAVIHFVAAILILVLLFGYKNGLNPKWAAHLYMIAAAGGIFGGCFYLDGLLNTSGVMLVPAITMLVGGKRDATIWFSISLIFLGLIYYLTINNYLDFKLLDDLAMQQYTFLSSAIGILVALFFSIRVFENEKNRAMSEVLIINEKLDDERKKSEELLLNILPEEVAQELKETGESATKLYGHVSVLFTDFVNFTGLSEELGPTGLIEQLNKEFTEFDKIIEKHGLEKIKTIGDAYLAVCGLPLEDEEHAQKCVAAALEIVESLEARKSIFQIRIGINSGQVVAGIVGVKKYAYDIWGATVNTAARMEQNSESGMVNISENTYEHIKIEYKCIPRGKIEAKNMGFVNMYFVEGKIH
jgi:class 3 adenylate cyclase